MDGTIKNARRSLVERLEKKVDKAEQAIHKNVEVMCISQECTE
jgi:hypothetical protein